MIEHYPFMDQLIGRTLPTNQGGEAGRTVEHLIEGMGLKVNRGKGLDLPALALEVKTRELTATSPQTIGKMRLESIKSTPYPDSLICAKFQRQLRIKTRNHIIVEAKIYDFSLAHIQQKIAESYEYGRAQIIANDMLSYYPPDGRWGYFEHVVKNSSSIDFRLSDTDMNEFENMATSSFRNIFEEVEV